ncbi:hypothetical protein BMW24_021085 [Mycobacterium heckeshornense]|uniref:Uncharacterized protein n=2 Tax=Mycobacteriaceae TaxID=1762 RepID=A0A2G8B1G7_9MYCO|nr:hypothetical protein [Mycobacterium heckeshornense]KMV21984.1 hypothetical protein ACT16_13500 [Mycobacterium heckeshornense]MCV7034504.1 hypothetical protein [Mycobacterium heckeshornense]PIJ31570.1 hypothetical protein BMW24_021085 [Mycobacterium heckeshornense]BCO33750.1 hypothetical protein MHEC_01830 [Mycobacterium heckeshornense]
MASTNPDVLEVLPPGLQGASGIIAAHGARVVSAAGSLSGSAELSGAAAAAVHGAFEGFCAAFAQRLSSASTALLEAASMFTAMEDTNTQRLGSIAPAAHATVRRV